MREFGGGSNCFCVAWALVLDLRTSVGFGPLALKGKDIGLWLSKERILQLRKWLLRGSSQQSNESTW